MSFDDLIYYPGIANERAPICPAFLMLTGIRFLGVKKPCRTVALSQATATQGCGDGATSDPSEPARLGSSDPWRLEAEIADGYVFDTRPLSDDRPYFAGYVKAKDLPGVFDRLEILQDEWGYLLLWFATLGVAALGALLLMRAAVLLWLADDGSSFFPGRPGIIVYFSPALGLGYIAVEIALLSKFVLALSNYTISAAVVITGMLIFSGVGSLLSRRFVDRARIALPPLLGAIGVLLIAEALWADRALDWIGTLSTRHRG